MSIQEESALTILYQFLLLDISVQPCRLFDRFHLGAFKKRWQIDPGGCQPSGNLGRVLSLECLLFSPFVLEIQFSVSYGRRKPEAFSLTQPRDVRRIDEKALLTDKLPHDAKAMSREICFIW